MRRAIDVALIILETILMRFCGSKWREDFSLGLLALVNRRKLFIDEYDWRLYWMRFGGAGIP